MGERNRLSPLPSEYGASHPAGTSRGPDEGEAAMAGPEDMRRAVAGYVQEIHRSYVDQAMTFPPAVRGRMPLLSGSRLTVAAVAARNLHLLATREPLGPLQGPEVRIEAEYEGLAWELRFYDCVVTPSLGLLDESAGPAFEEVKHALGVTTVVYHLVAQVGAGLSGHQASHVGTGLANGHSAVARDFETIRSRARGREGLVDEMAGAATAGLRRAQALLARTIAPHNPEVVALAEAAEPDPDALRKALLGGFGGRTQWSPPAAAEPVPEAAAEPVPDPAATP
jgi:hypothetical protein